MDFIYETIKAKFQANQALFTDCGMSIIRHFDTFKSQYVYPEMHHLYKKPALFYEWQAAWTDAGRLVQDGDVTIRLHLELENYGEQFTGIKKTGQAVDSRNKDHAELVFKYATYVNALVLGLSGSAFTPLRRIANDPDLSPTNSNVQIITYKCRVTDDTALQLTQQGLIKEPLDDMTTEQVPTRPGAAKDITVYQVD